MPDKPSGKEWVGKFPTSRSLSDLKGGFASAAKKFLAAITKAGAKVKISATYRPPERAYLMHYSFLIAKGLDPTKVPALAGVDIDWTHKDKAGKADPKEALKAAKEMVSAYGIAYKPALKSRHTQGLAIDMDISWSDQLSIEDAKSKTVEIKSNPRSGGNKELQDIGAGYGVVKLASDPPHWSSDGH